MEREDRDGVTIVYDVLPENSPAAMSRKRQGREAEEVDGLAEGQKIYVVKKPAGPNLFECSDGLSESLFVVELPPRFRKVLWIRRGLVYADLSSKFMSELCMLGSYVIVSPFGTVEGQSNEKIHDGEIATVIQPDQIKSWRKRGIWSVHIRLPCPLLLFSTTIP